jgi:type III restriction enzyme
LEIKADTNGVKARFGLNKKLKTGFKVAQIFVRSGDDLSRKTGLSEYDGFIVTEINAKYNFVRFSNGVLIELGKEVGGDRARLMQVQIEQTIGEHFRKHCDLKQYGIKVLSLFFIDRVDNYFQEEGIIRKYFVDAFNKLKQQFDEFKDVHVNSVQRGYFSKSRNSKLMEEDRDAFNLIMKDKKRLLSFEEPVQFIFTRSALREGWDNPNVFNICTLNETISKIKKRQEIGRGMRLPVNQDGERMLLGEHNILTVIANESYADYVSKLQHEYAEEYGDEIVPPKPLNAKNE